jgi:hypothetical protein
VTVNVHQEQADLFKWTRMADEPNFAAMQHLRTLTLGENVVILGSDGVKTGVFVNAPAGVGTWTEVASLGVEASKNAVVKGDTLFVVDSSMLKWSLDAVTFHDAAELTGIKRLVGACLTELYAYDTDGNSSEFGQLGKGVLLRVLDANMIARKDIIKFQKECLDKVNVPYQYFISPGGTDAGSIHKSLSGIPTMTYCLVARNIHSCSSILDVDDYLNSIKGLNKILTSLNDNNIKKFKFEL